ncbi:hypothetical protein LOTGIDRAFT_162841 [Lottia gigantea]|uniref:Phospholipase A2-like domain-containing protein n=1 Tax=Lottia gigantea TaxID=225164 RepID=V4AAQ5_LOTGI|nr:hypothetical protein LOTGIDRAFT_162841 [Lottia gigantea]ESO92185.1 hypothetical protein LOTGIDRAFT_162841 [Lottia gigantea]
MIVAHAPKTYFGSGDIQKSLGSLPGFPWAKYPGEKHLPCHNYTGPGTRLDLRLDENDKPKPGEEPVNRVDAAALKHDILYRNKDINFRHEADRQMIIELENIPNPTFKDRMQRALIIKLLKAKMKLGMGLADEIHKEFRKTKNFLKVKSPENDNDAVHKKYLRDQINSIEVNKNHLEDKISNVKRFFKRQLNNKNVVNDTKLQQEVIKRLISFIQKELVNVANKTELQNLISLISKLEDKIAKQKLDIQQLIENEDTFQQELNALETKLNSELQKELTNIKQQIQNIDEIKTYIQQQIQNIDDSEIKTYIHQQIQNIDDSVIQQQITTINNLVLKQDKNIVALEKKFLKEESYYFNLPFRNLGFFSASITNNIDKSKDYEYKTYGFTANIRVYCVPNYTIHPNYIFDDDDEDDYRPINFTFRGKLIIEITFPFQVKVDSIFFTQDSHFSDKKFNAQKVLQFINGTKNVETKEFEINDENNKPRHLYEIKTSGKYIDRFKMLIIPDKEEDEFILSDFDMLLATETPPSMNIIRNLEPQKEGNMSYEFLRTSDFEYVKLYFVNND